MEIKVNTGLITYNLGGKVEVAFNPTDMSFGDRLYKAIGTLCALQEKPLTENTEDLLADMLARDKEARAVLDGLFEKEVCKPLYDTISVFALADGLPLWANLLLAIMGQMQEGSSKRMKEAEARIKKYTKDYEL
ncbi:MAG: hypothetical protein IKE23_07020 [Exiguobacterium sp.]|nr:hypothetical protein [Exiguobacterium sp.]